MTHSYSYSGGGDSTAHCQTWPAPLVSMAAHNAATQLARIGIQKRCEQIRQILVIEFIALRLGRAGK